MGWGWVCRWSASRSRLPFRSGDYGADETGDPDPGDRGSFSPDGIIGASVMNERSAVHDHDRSDERSQCRPPRGATDTAENPGFSQIPTSIGVASARTNACTLSSRASQESSSLVIDDVGHTRSTDGRPALLRARRRHPDRVPPACPTRSAGATKRRWQLEAHRHERRSNPAASKRAQCDWGHSAAETVSPVADIELRPPCRDPTARRTLPPGREVSRHHDRTDPRPVGVGSVLSWTS